MREAEETAFRDLVRALQGPLFGFLGRMGLSQHQAEEIAQETFLKVWRNLGAYRAEKASLATWTFAIARNLALNAAARASTLRENPYGEHPPEIASGEPLASEALEARQDRERLRRALLALPPGDRALLALIYVQELSHADAARIEGCSVGAIKTRAHRAKTRLRQIMEEDDGR
jgi:RNA polymerase sigma-70 factor, ECF subfamily